MRRSRTDALSPVCLLQPHVLEAELADPQLGTLAVLLGIGAEVPGVNLEPANLDSVDILDLHND